MAVLTMDLVCGKRSDPHGVCGSGIILPGMEMVVLLELDRE